MPRGLLLVKAHAKAQGAISNALKKIRGVWDAYPVFGRFDFVVFLQGKTLDDVAEAARNVKAVSGIASTETLLEGV